MKLRTITELFDKVNMNNVTAHPPKRGNNIDSIETALYRYTFKDPNLPQSPNYIVTLSSYTIYPPYKQQTMRDIIRVISAKATAAIQIMDDPPTVQSLGIDLETEESLTDLTNLGNSIYVYSKLVAILINHIQETRIPEFIRYFGSEADMDITYHRLNTTMAKKYPQLAYDKISDTVYINRDYYNKNKKYFETLKTSNDQEIAQYKQDKNKRRHKNHSL